MCCCPVAVQFGVQFFILAVHFNSFCVEVNGAAEIPFVVLIVTLIVVNLCNCYNTAISNYFSDFLKLFVINQRNPYLLLIGLLPARIENS